jgi:hypothetical protein
MRECREDVLLGMIRLVSPWSRVPGRPSRSLVRGRTKEEWLLSDGPMIAVGVEFVGSGYISESKLLVPVFRNMPDIGRKVS